MAHKRKLVLFVSSGAIALTVAGCNGPGTSGAAPKAPAFTNTPLIIVPGPNGNFQPNFSPFQGNSNPGTGGFIYQPLFYFNTVGPQTYPLLGQSFRWSSDGRTLTVTLRNGAKWSDGATFTSADVLFTFNLLKQYPDADTNSNWNQLTTVAVHGPHQVIFRYKNASVPFGWYTLGQTYIVPQHIWSKIHGDPTKASVPHPMGTGPYVLSSFNPQAYTMKANPLYYEGTPAVRNLSFPAYTGNDSGNLALAKGKIDWGGMFIPNITGVYTNKNPNYKYWFPPQSVIMLYANLKNPLLSQLPVRQAMSLAIDRQKIYLEGEYGYEPVASPTGLVLPNNNSWLDPALPAADRSFQHNPAAAVRLLEHAGYKKNAQGIFVSPSGQPLSFSLQVVSGWTDWDTDCQLIASDLKKIGINVSVQEEQFGSYFSNISGKTKNYELAISWTNTGPTPYYLYQNMLSPTGGWNVPGWNNPATTLTLTKFQNTTNLTAQKQAVYKLQRVMAEQLPAIPLVYGATWYEYNTTHFVGWPDAAHAYAMPAPWSYPANAVVIMKLRPR